MKELPFKGFILPDGTILDSEHTLSHERIAFDYIRSLGLTDRFRASKHSSAQDFLLYELNAMQVRTGGEQILVLLVKNYKYFSKYIKEYQHTDKRWKLFLLSGN